MTDYQEPPWASIPTAIPDSPWRLLEIKGGVQVAQHDLQPRACTLLGRAQDVVHVVLGHESCSRLHARIAFDQANTPWLRDLGSTHGTVVNKKRLPPAACGKTESLSTETGARGVVLYPGDILQFGASTRLFCLEGPASFARGQSKPKTAVVAPVKQQSSQPEDIVNEKGGKDTGDSIVSWGIDMTDGDETKESHEEKFVLNQDDIPEKHQKAFETIKALRYKLSNVQSESERIRRKVELTPGQERQLQRNAERERELQQTIAEKEQHLYRILHPQNEPLQAQKEQVSDFGIEDDVDDRTREQHDGLDFCGDGETEDSLRSKWNDARNRRLRVVRELDAASTQVNHLAARIKQLHADGDEDAFFLQNDYNLATENQRKFEEQKKRLESVLQQTEELLKIANPRLNVDLETGFIGEGMPPTSVFMAPPPSRAGTLSSTSIDAEEKISDRPSPPIERVSPTEQGQAASKRTEPGFVMPPPKKKRVLGPQMPPPGDLSVSSQRTQDNRIALKSTLAALSSKPSPVRNTKEPSASKVIKVPALTDDDSRQEASKSVQQGTSGKVDIWRPPKDQDGSGRSKLNEKFAGRY